MKRFQFSISGIFVLTFLVAIVLSLRGGLGSQWSFETIWIAVFVLAYWKSPKRGWRQVVRATGTTAVICGVLILCVYASFLYRRGAPRAVELALHGSMLALVAVVLAAAAASLVEGIRAIARYWLRGTWPRRVVVALALVASITLVLVGWMTLRPRYWEPVSATSSGRAFREGLPRLAVGAQGSDVDDAWLVDASPDGKLVAAIPYGSQKVLVFDAASGELVASFAAASEERFYDVTFHPDGSVLAALLYSQTGARKLARWDMPACTPREPVSLDHLVDRPQPVQNTWLSLERCLFVVRGRPLDERTGKVEVSTVDLLDEQLAPRPFASGDVDITTAPNRLDLWSFADPQDGIVSRGGDWICVAGKCLCRGDTAATKLPGRALGFFRNTHCLAVQEKSDAFYWKRERPREWVRPPFWNYLRMGVRFRVSIYDGGTQQVIARTRWFTQLGQPRMSPDGSQLLAKQGDSVLIWEFPQVSGD
jgi:hypothetical protein